jgi:hypothetical protein
VAYEKIQKKLLLIRNKTSINNNKEMYEAVKNILDKEKRKKFNKDLELIDECVETLLMLRGYDIENIDVQAEISKERTLDKIRNETSDNQSRILFKKKYVLVTIIIISFMVLFQIGAMAFGTNPIVEMYNFFIANTDITTVTKDGITFTYLDNTKPYNSIEELIKKENLDIVYPSELPKEIKFENIRKYDVDGYTKYFLTFNEEQLNWQINEKHNTSIDKLDSYKKVIINNLEYYILNENTTCEIIFFYNNYEYYISYTDYDTLIYIIENLNIGEK